MKFILPFLLTLSVAGLAEAANTAPVPWVPAAGDLSETRVELSPGSPLKKNVDFWIRIYTQYDTNQGLIHDAKYIDKVYEVLDRPHESSRVLAARQYWEKVLLSVHRKQDHPETLNADETRVYKLYADVHEPNKFLDAAHRKRLRFQLGQKDRFIEGLKASGRYLTLMESVFRNADLPIELSRLPFVESSFNVRARSKVGASGVWQFMRSTGKLFLRIDDAVDERNDPIRAAEAATRLLRGNYDSLQNWSLAVTAYNHGRKGMMRAVRKVGSDRLDDVVESYRGHSFGFASSNFYTELLAAIEVERHADQYFGKIQRDPPMQAFEVALPTPINFHQMCRFLKLDKDHLHLLNPAITEAAWAGKIPLPAGYRLRLPAEPGMDTIASTRVFLAGFNEIPSIYKRSVSFE